MNLPGDFLFFDNAASTRCCRSALEALRLQSEENYANPSSHHGPGHRAARAIGDARDFFAGCFGIPPAQVLFTSGGTESDNLAISGVALRHLERQLAGEPVPRAPRILVSSIEHPAVRKAALSLAPLGFDVRLLPVDARGQLRRDGFIELLTPETILVSIHQVNNIVGSILPVEELARLAKERVPGVLFHTDAVQGFGRVPHPRGPSPVDLVSVSAHKIEGPKGVGALFLLNPLLAKDKPSRLLRPLFFGGDQEDGLRSGTPSVALIASFRAAAEETLASREQASRHFELLRAEFRRLLGERGLLASEPGEPRKGSLALVWNSPEETGVRAPHIVSLSVLGAPSGALAGLLEEAGCIVSTGSACSSGRADADPVLLALGRPEALARSGLRVSFGRSQTIEEVARLVEALARSMERVRRLRSFQA
jgi:cysteine desulfurase